MRKMKTAALALALALLLTACSEKGPKHDITFISEDYISVFEHYTGKTLDDLKRMAEPEEGAQQPKEPREGTEDGSLPEEGGGSEEDLSLVTQAEALSEEGPEEDEIPEDEEIPEPPREEDTAEEPEEEPAEEEELPLMPLLFVDDENCYTVDSGRRRIRYLDKDTLADVRSVTICDDSITDREVARLIELLSDRDIPLFIMGARPSEETMALYDKVFCIGADYRYLGEAFAEMVNGWWLQVIPDRNSDQILQFTTIKGENTSPRQQVFYDSFVRYIELLGIPLQELDCRTVSREGLIPYFNSAYHSTECFIILDVGYLKDISAEYEGDSDRIAMIGIVQDVSDPLAGYPFVRTCFLDYTRFFEARDRINTNIDRKVYPLKDIPFDVIDRYVYIDPAF